MARIKLSLCDLFSFSTEIPVRISDLNYGNHMANQVFLEFMQEARMRFLAQFGYSEKDLAGVGVIMGDTAIVFKKECFYGDVLKLEVVAVDFGSRSFDLQYRFTNQDGIVCCEAKTGMVCYNYSEAKTVAVPEMFRQKVLALQGSL